MSEAVAAIDNAIQELERERASLNAYIDLPNGFEVNEIRALRALKIAVKALQFDCGNRCAIGLNPCSASEALTAIEQEFER